MRRAAAADASPLPPLAVTLPVVIATFRRWRSWACSVARLMPADGLFCFSSAVFRLPAWSRLVPASSRLVPAS